MARRACRSSLASVQSILRRKSSDGSEGTSGAFPGCGIAQGVHGSTVVDAAGGSLPRERVIRYAIHEGMWSETVASRVALETDHRCRQETWNRTVGAFESRESGPARAAERHRRPAGDESWSVLPTWPMGCLGALPLSRPFTADLVAWPDDPDTHPLKWAVPDDYAAGAPRLLKRLTRLATHKTCRTAATRLLEDWLADPAAPAGCAVGTRVDRLVPSPAPLGQRRSPRICGALLYDTLQRPRSPRRASPCMTIRCVTSCSMQNCLWLWPSSCRSCSRAATWSCLPSSALSFALVELLDGEGLVCAAHLAHFRLLLACWTRCSLMDKAAGWQCFDRECAQSVRVHGAAGPAVVSARRHARLVPRTERGLVSRSAAGGAGPRWQSQGPSAGTPAPAGRHAQEEASRERASCRRRPCIRSGAKSV